MSVQFGRWNTDGKPVDPDFAENVKPVIAPYGPDDGGSYNKTGICILYRAFQTTKESRCELQPHVTDLGAIITWDSRLDNRTDLIRNLRDRLTISCTDVSIVAAAYEEWGTNCFAKLVGDWALSIWDAKSRSLILAKDPIGTRHLYYSIEQDQITWSTLLDPLVLFAGHTFALNEEYFAGWFSFFPAAHLTPYGGIHSVPPSCYVAIRNEKLTLSKYWDFDPGRSIRYHTDAEYEEHFRAVFGEAVRRRLRSDSPILAELSGGMDSTSIVCVADSIIACGSAETPRLDTISYYNDSEPNWNERPYFTKVEEQRGRTGCHVDLSLQEMFNLRSIDGHFAATPGPGNRCYESAQKFAACMKLHGNRVVLSGVGGDEVMGGVPTPTPELQDLLVNAELKKLIHQLKAWALNKRKPWFHLLFEAAGGFFPRGLASASTWNHPVPWLKPGFVKRNGGALQGYETRTRIFGAIPSFQANISALNTLRRQVGCSALSCEPPYEKRFPYLDRGLLEFGYSIPREQFVRPGQRRSLMRRALAGVVPQDILDRKRKAFVARGPRAAICTEWASLTELSQHMTISSLGIVDEDIFSSSLQEARTNGKVSITRLVRTLYAEAWLRNLRTRGIAIGAVESPAGLFNCLSQNEISAERN